MKNQSKTPLEGYSLHEKIYVRGILRGREQGRIYNVHLVFEDKPSPERRLLNYEVQMIYHGEKPFHMAEVDFKKIMSNLNEFQRERAQQLVSEWREDQNENIEKTFFNNENL